MKYSNYNELKGRIVSPYDTIVFNLGENLYRYNVTFSYLSNIDGHNDEIFRDLQIDKWKFCRNAYGYVPTNYDNPEKNTTRSFPESQYNDHVALTKVVLALFKICEQKNTPKFNQIKMI